MTDLYAINPAVTRYISDNYGDAELVLELGGGRGSALLHSLLPNVVTVEDNPKYCTLLVAQRCNYIHAPIRRGWYSVNEQLTAAFEKADVIIVDGPTGSLRQNVRGHLHRIKPGAVVVFDDTHRRVNYNIVRDCVAEGWEELESMRDAYNRRTHILRKPAKEDA